MNDYLSPLENCQLCEWKCGVNRLAGERGVCRLERPRVASRTLHPAPPQSYTIFMAGCNFKCLGCQNWEIAHYPDTGESMGSLIEPGELAREALRALESPQGQMIGADRIFFSGGDPVPSLPYIEKVVHEARNMGEVKVNFDTNGFMTLDSLKRIIDFTTSITFDLKAYHDEVHRALTGAPSGPVLRNARYIAREARGKIWEFRILLIPHLNEGEVRPLAEFLAEIDPHLPLCFLSFRPNFVLENHPGADLELMKKAVRIAQKAGLKKVSWGGRTGIPGVFKGEIEKGYLTKEGGAGGSYAARAGCITHPRECGTCPLHQDCPVKSYTPGRHT